MPVFNSSKRAFFSRDRYEFKLLSDLMYFVAIVGALVVKYISSFALFISPISLCKLFSHKRVDEAITSPYSIDKAMILSMFKKFLIVPRRVTIFPKGNSECSVFNDGF